MLQRFDRFPSTDSLARVRRLATACVLGLCVGLAVIEAAKVLGVGAAWAWPIAVLAVQILHLGLAEKLQHQLSLVKIERSQVLARAIETSFDERRRLAADLHNGVVQDLAGTTFALAAAAERASNSYPEFADDLHRASADTRESLISLRSFLDDIYPPNLKVQGLEAALADRLAPAATMDIKTELTVTGDLERLSERVALVYRVAQEAINNALLHADPQTLSVSVATSSDAIFAAISDDGCGYDPAGLESSTGLGVRIMHDLVEAAGGSLSILSSPGTGTTVRLRIAK